MGAKKFEMCLETRETKLLGRDIPRFCWDVPAVPEKFEKICLFSIFGPYVCAKLCFPFFKPFFVSNKIFSGAVAFCRHATLTQSKNHWETKGRFRNRVVLELLCPRSGFRSGGTCERTLVPVFVPGEHPPKPPFWKTTLLSTPEKRS